MKAFQIKQHRESPACREAHLHIPSQNFMAERVQAVPSDFAFEEESNSPPVAEADPCVGPAEEVMVEVDDTKFATCPGFCPEQLQELQNILQVVSICDTHSRGDPKLPGRPGVRVYPKTCNYCIRLYRRL